MSSSVDLRLKWIIAGSLISWGFVKLHQRGRRPPDIPPGPPTIPMVGNVPIMPKGFSFLQMTTWAHEFGEIYSLMAGPGGTMIILTSPRAIYDILERQGLVTSNRPQTLLINLMTGGLTIGASNPGTRWRSGRRVLSEILSPQACARHLPLHVAESTQLMLDMLQRPEDTYTHVQRFTTSIMLSTVYGQRTPRFTSPMITAIHDISTRYVGLQSFQSAKWVQRFPILQYLPERFAGWKTLCKGVRRDMRGLLDGLLQDVEGRINRGESNNCYMESVVEMSDSLELNREEICYLGWSTMVGGSVTIASWLHFFVLCITAHPEVQLKAQKEIDAIVGDDRTPELEDIDGMPYVQAIINEVSRFRPHNPIVFPHVASADLRYGNYRIPSGSLILANTWGVYRDENLFADPDSFDPERFLDSPYGLRAGVEIEDEEAFKRLNLLPWGCGRRFCPGIHLAQQTIAITAMNLLWAFTFNKARNPKDGTEIEVDLWGFDFISMADPHPFVVNPTLRSSARAEVIRREYLASSAVFEKFERELAPEDRDYVTRIRAEVSRDQCFT